MSTTTTLIGRTGRILAATTLALGLPAVIAAAPASAAPAAIAAQPSATLTIIDIGYDQYRVSVRGVFPMSRADAEGRLRDASSAGGMRYTLHGAEPADHGDDIRYVSAIRGPAANTAVSSVQDTPEGLRYAHSFVVDRSVLNEDGGPTDADDEIYVHAEFIDGGGGRHSTSDVLRAQY